MAARRAGKAMHRTGAVVSRLLVSSPTNIVSVATLRGDFQVHYLCGSPMCGASNMWRTVSISFGRPGTGLPVLAGHGGGRGGEGCDEPWRSQGQGTELVGGEVSSANSCGFIHVQ